MSISSAYCEHADCQVKLIMLVHIIFLPVTTRSFLIFNRVVWWFLACRQCERSLIARTGGGSMLGLYGS